LLDARRLHIAKDPEAHFTDAADEFTARIRGDRRTDLKVVGENGFDDGFREFQIAILIPFAAEAIENSVSIGQGCIHFALPKIGGGVESQVNLTIS
jgi:hypothetical protein